MCVLVESKLGVLIWGANPLIGYLQNSGFFVRRSTGDENRRVEIQSENTRNGQNLGP